MNRDQASRLRSLMAERGAAERDAAVQDSAGPTGPGALTLAVVSGKGGVGKTNVAVNTAVAAAAAGARTVLADCDLGLANADVLLDLPPGPGLGEVVQSGRPIESALADAPNGLRVLRGASGRAALADLDPAGRRRLAAELDRLRSACDLLVVDVGAGAGTAVREHAAAADRVWVVTTPEPTAVTDAYALVKLLHREGFDPGPGGLGLGLVINLAAHEKEARHVADGLAGVVRRFLDVEISAAGWVPADPLVCAAVRRRRPVVLDRRPGPAAARLTALGRALAAEVRDAAAEPRPSRARGLLRRLFLPVAGGAA